MGIFCSIEGAMKIFKCSKRHARRRLEKYVPIIFYGHHHWKFFWWTTDVIKAGAEAK